MNFKQFDKQKAVALFTGLTILCFVLFQNCSKVNVKDLQSDDLSKALASPSTTTTTMPAPPPPSAHGSILIEPQFPIVSEGQKGMFTVSFQDLENITYMCQDKLTGQILSSGQIKSSGSTFDIIVNQDITCEASGTVQGSVDTLRDSAEVSVNCANRIKNTSQNRCEDFSCKKIVTMTDNDLDNVPARDQNGICYAFKVMDKIANGPSSATVSTDKEITSRNHDSSSASKHRNPYLMRSANPEFRLAGPRVVKLAGGLDANKPILVDNFILTGVYPSTVDPTPDLAVYYKVMGTSDSSIYDDTGKDTKSIRFMKTLLPITAYATGGTSSVTAVDITRSVEPGIYHNLDIRALDCGGSRQLSDIYLLFQ